MKRTEQAVRVHAGQDRVNQWRIVHMTAELCCPDIKEAAADIMGVYKRASALLGAGVEFCGDHRVALAFCLYSSLSAVNGVALRAGCTA